MTKTLTVKKPTTQALASWESRLAADAKDAAASERVVGQSISLRGGQMTFNGVVLKSPLNVIVLDYIPERTFYEGDFDPDEKAAPTCFAMSRNEENMVPHESVIEKQHPTCNGCKWDAWGSADKGKGKACKERRRLAVMMAGQIDTMAEADVAMLRVPVTSVKKWKEYVHGLKSALNRPPYAVITELHCTPDPKTQVALSFKVAGKLDAEHADALDKKREDVKPLVEAPYQSANKADEEKEAKPARKVKYR